MEKKTLGGFISVLRKAKGLTQQELADKLNVSNKAVSKWECNETSPDISLLPVIAEVLEVSCDELLRGERIFSDGKSEKSEKRGEKQLKYLVNKSILRYKNLSLVSFMVVFIGLVLMYTLSYSAYRPDIGFAVAVSLFFAAIVVQVFSLGWLNNQTINNELFDDIKEKGESESFVKAVKGEKYKYSFAVFYLVFFAVFLILPFIIFRHNEIIKSVLSFDSYLEYLPIFMVLPVSIVFAAKELYRNLIYKSKNKKGLIVFDWVQTGIFVILVLLYFIAALPTGHYSDLIINYNSNSTYPIIISTHTTGFYINFSVYLGILIGFIVCLVVAAIKTKNKKTIKKSIFITLRNLAYLAAVMMFFASSVRYGNGETYYASYHVIRPINSLYSGLIVILATLAYFLLTRNKNFYDIDEAKKSN